MARSCKKTCGGCAHWQKITLSGNGRKSGLCTINDWRCNSDDCCNQYTKIPYSRTKKEVI